MDHSAAQDLEQCHISSFGETVYNEHVLKSGESCSMADLSCGKAALQSGFSSLFLLQVQMRDVLLFLTSGTWVV